MSPFRHRVAWAGLLLMAACGGERLPPPDVVARVGGREIAYSEFEAYLRRNSIEVEATLDDATSSRLFDRFLEEQAVLELARDRGLVETTADPAEALAALVEAVDRPQVTAADVAAHYRAHADAYELPERVRLSQILVADREAAAEAARRLAADEPFEEVARSLSQEPAAGRGGDQGVLTREDLPPAFVDVVFDLPEGGISDPVSADYGYHIFRVTRRWPAEEVPLELAAPEIQARLEAERRRAARQQVVEEAGRRYNVRVQEKNLPFRYSGALGDG